LSDSSAPQFLYLSTLGWKSGKRHRIEIWFVEHGVKYYVVSERKKQAHWVRNLMHNSSVSFTVSEKSFDGSARVVPHDTEKDLASTVSELMKTKYGWGDGLIVELTPKVVERK
jgi:deazaflavin-dependent oxidoreductase (nitroreductase family)